MNVFYRSKYQEQILVSLLYYSANSILNSQIYNKPIDSQDVKLYRVREKECAKFGYVHNQYRTIEKILSDSGF